MSDAIEILIVDTDRASWRVLFAAVEAHGAWPLRLVCAADPAQARECLRQALPALVIVPLDSADDPRLVLLREIAEQAGAPAVLAVTPPGERVCVTAVRFAGVSDYVPRDELTPAALERSLLHLARQRGEQARTADLLAAVTATVPHLLVVWDARERVLACSRAMLAPEDADAPRRELPTLEALTGMPETLLRAIRATARPLWRGTRREISADSRISDLAGLRRRVSLVQTSVTDERGEVHAVVTHAEDRSDQEAIETRLEQAGRLEAMGAMTAGIAHDFNNLLTIMRANLELLEGALDGQADLLQYVENALGYCERGASLNRKLQSFSPRWTPGSVRGTLLAENIAAVAAMIGHALGPRHAIRCDVEPMLWQARVNGHEFDNAIINLLINARDALPEGGVITIEARNVAQPPVRIAGQRAARVPCVAVTVADPGAGMPPAIRLKATEPFFTTKPPGKGTGLGLSMVKRFVTDSAGWLDIDSSPAWGTRVTLYLPADPLHPERSARPGSNARAT